MQYTVIEKGCLTDTDVYLFFKDENEPNYTFLLTSISDEVTLTVFDETGNVDYDITEEHIELLESHFEGL